MRRRSIAGPLILILLGALFLVYNLRPDLRLLELIAVYWPFLLIGWGLIRVAEVVASFMRGQPQRGGFSGGEIVLIVLICLGGSAAYSAHRHGIRLGGRGVEMFGQPFDFPVSAERPAPGVRRVVFENRRGNLRIGGSDAPEIRVSGNLTVRALGRTEAERTHRNTPLEIVVEGDTAIVRTNQERVPESQRLAADLEVTVPRGVRVEVRGRMGDYDVNDVDGNVEITGERADVRLNRIGGDVRVELRRSNIVRAMDVKGSVEVQGRGNDVELENIAGLVTIGGSYAGALDFKNLAKPLRFESANTDLRVEALPGHISFNLGEFAARNVVGPIRLTTRSRDVKIEDFTDTLDLETERGDIELQPGRVPLGRIEARSRSGRIELVLPAKATFQLRATTEHGDAINDFGPPIKRETDGRSASLKGEVGKGPAINLTTGRGAVSVRKAEGPAKAQL
jgi:DUF4097 and DUF4098 domain-containing protein YvlB